MDMKRLFKSLDGTALQVRFTEDGFTVKVVEGTSNKVEAIHTGVKKLVEEVIGDEVTDKKVQKAYEERKGILDFLATDEDPEDVDKEQQEYAVVRDYEAGIRVSDILAKHNISSGRMYSILRRRDVGTRHEVDATFERVKHIMGNEAVLTELESAYLNKEKSVRELMTLYNLNRNELYYILDSRSVSGKQEGAKH